MPTITASFHDILSLIGHDISLEKFEEYLALTKGELKGYDEEIDEAKIELNDTNRPDLWCAEGIARQIRMKLNRKPEAWPYVLAPAPSSNRVVVHESIQTVRPFVGAFVAKGMNIDEPTLVQIIQTQEKLCENFGGKRAVVAMGVYNAAKIAFPVHYKGVCPTDVSFVPLDFEEPMTLAEILERHPKGIDYRYILEDADIYPILMDSEDTVLSFPPIINSRALGEVKIGDKDLFVEATGPDIGAVVLALNIMAANLFDRGAVIEPVIALFPYNTELGREVKVPYDFGEQVDVELTEISAALGEEVTMEDVKTQLEEYGCPTIVSGSILRATCPPYRRDYIHPVDVVEDFAISRGYDTFDPIMPSTFTVGKLDATTLLADRVRDYMVGYGFQEIISNILSNRTQLRESLCRTNDDLVEIDNVMSETYSVVRDSLIPSLLHVEASSSKAIYPHRIFEVGEIAVYAPEMNMGSRTATAVGALIAENEASFSTIHSYLDALLYYLNIVYQLVAVEDPSYIPGRVGKVVSGDRILGIIGEIHPQVMENLGIRIPCVVFEVVLEEDIGNS